MTGRPNYKGPKDLRDIHTIPIKDRTTPESSEYGMDTPETMPKVGFSTIGDGCYRRKARGTNY